MSFLITKALVSGVIIAIVSELAKRNNLVASVVHSLPLMSILAFIWLYTDTKDAMFLVMPWLIEKLGGFWPALAVGLVGTVALYAATMKLLELAEVQL
jgi:hypothetical protein